MDIIIVESPTKAKTLTKFLHGSYRVEATMGHIRDLPKSELGVDIEHDFMPSYVTPRDKQKRVRELREIVADSSKVILATDPDREGEAIAWHVSEILSKPGKSRKSKKTDKSTPQEDLASSGNHPKNGYQRIVFHEITESAIKSALDNPRKIDMQLVNAQQARRVLDRLVGYKLSPLLWQKLSRRWLSAGRVQSVTVRLIVEREREIAKFTKQRYFTIESVFRDTTSDITAQLVSKNGEKFESTLTFELFDGKYTTTVTTIKTREAAQAIIDDLRTPFTVSLVDRKEIRRAPAPPFTTSTLQQDAGRKLYFSSKKTMQVAQRLYEEGMITYHRTDSVNLAEKFITETRDYISRTWGPEFIPKAFRKYQTKSKVAQEAHEAIRPTRVDVKSENIVEDPKFNRDHVRLYEMIWKRAIASQASEAVFDSTTINIRSGNGYLFQAQGSVIKFYGYLKITGFDNHETVLPSVAVGQELNLVKTEPLEHESAPPPRYSEATLVKALEEKDIGRPSTYAPIISTVMERNYIERVEKKLIPTELGFAVTDFLVQYFPTILSLPFTATLEGRLDEIANGSTQWTPVIRDFFQEFQIALDQTYNTAQKVKMVVETIDEKCPTCGNPLVIRIGRYGKFIACSTYPKCTYTKQLLEKIDKLCPRCGGDIVVKKSKRGKTFYGCSNYPKCNFAAWKKEDIK